ncbi:MAG: ATP-dependent DNA helicase RecG, partial [Nocardioides sp.]|nr:ATP-dependent DNA helicase RecG [Nocardioides sp.]
LLADDVHFHQLGLVVVDEQHRFGVEQRAALRDKGVTAAADMLVMTATPIPRTAAMTVFGDRDQSVLDELPPGRTPIDTTWVDGDVDLADVDADPWPRVRSQVEQGRQAYVVCPLVTESETQAAKSATETLEALTEGALAGLRIGLVHGKQKPAERDQAMRQFKDGQVDVLVATTVIEVGVNVPNASIIVVLDAGRFGMAQLHQLRGRVGRGSYASHCVLVGEGASGDAARRLGALCESTDGFFLSEVDLEIRGEGAVFGARQSGMSDLRVASLRGDRDLVSAAREDAAALLDPDPDLGRRPGLRAEVRTALGEDAEEWLTRS